MKIRDLQLPSPFAIAPMAGMTDTAFRRLVKWRTGCEGRISHLKHRYGWHRTRLTTLTGARIWCGHGILAHNLIKITALAAAQTP